MAYINTDNTNSWQPPIINQVQKKGELQISFNSSSFAFNLNPGAGTQTGTIHLLEAIIKKPSGRQLSFNWQPSMDFFILRLDEEGEYVIRFNLKFRISSAYGGNSAYLDYQTNRESYFAVAPEEQLSPFTIKDVIDRTLAVTPTRTKSGTNKYTFRNNAEEYATEESPEFTFTGKHLFEVMLDVSSYKKMFPALDKEEIYFRPLWNGVTLTSDDLPPPTKAVLCSAIDQYCMALDSYVENMVCVNDTNVGTVVEPYKNGYVSARSNSGSEISETTAVIPTQSGIYQSLDMKVGEVNGVVVGDIQSYIYEQEDYDSLSDTSGAYPYSKGYALKFTRFSKDYTELSHRIKKGPTLSDALTYPALANITKAKCGEEVGTNLKTYLSSFIGNNTAAPFADLLFQPTYIPVVNARVRQYKPMMSEEDYDATLFYNQQSEVVDSEAFGEHVKGLVQKLGNHTEIRVYRFGRVDDVPTVGTLIDGKSVYNVSMMIFENHVNATICLVDYAELSTYIGVKNEIKTSDISSTKWCNRFINWEEFLVFTHDDECVGDALSITNDALAGLVSFDRSDPLTCAMFTTHSESGGTIMTALAPLKHLALGNSIYFQWEMLDNFAVGYKSEKAPEGATSLMTGTMYDRAQRAVRYCDVYGRMETIDFQLLKTGPTCDNSHFVSPTVEVTWDNEEKSGTVSIDRVSNIYWKIVISLDAILDGGGWGHYSQTVVFAPGETSKTITFFDVDFANNAEEEDGVSVEDVDMALDTEQQRGAYARCLAHEYPQLPNDLIFTPIPSFRLNNLLVKKNSAEALKFAAQYHFRQMWREFVIGSGMSNFCSLVGGSCSQLQFLLLRSPLNRFERHIPPEAISGNWNVESETFVVEGDKKRIKISLPQNFSSLDKIQDELAWALAGKDRNGNWQLIFGENRSSLSVAFEPTIYLVAKAKKK